MSRQKKCEKKIIYYQSGNEEFSGVSKKQIRVGADFPYLHKNPLWNFTAKIVYRGIMTPFAFLWCKIKFGYRVVGREKLKHVSQKEGYFVYANHTLLAGDAFLPSMVAFPRRVYPIVNAENLSTPGTRNYIQMNGAIPLPTEFSGMRNFLNAMEKRLLQKHCIYVYPEAHIWPYYTGIREFGSAAFRYPVRFSAPVFSATTTFQKRAHRKTPRVTVYLDGPFYPDRTVPARQAEQFLRDAVYSAMCARSENSTYSPYEYIKADVKGESEA